MAATAALIAERGIAGVTHRRIAARAGVPLGSTTYYFPSLAGLIDAALEHVADSFAAELRRWRDSLARSPGSAALVELAEGYLADRARAVVEYELYLAAAHESRLRGLASMWIEQLHAILAPLTGSVRARAISMFLDGAILRALLRDERLDVDAVRAGLRALLDER